MLVPGLNLMVGPPKTFKSFLILNVVASMMDKQPVGGDKRKVPLKKGPCVYFAAEQSASSLKHIYQERVLRRKMSGPTSWDFIVPRDPWAWQLDDVQGEHDLVKFAEEWKPMILVLDPLVYFHKIDENDPQMVRPLVPLRKAMLKHGGALVVVHHARKESSQGTPSKTSGGDWNKVRGTSALWAMSDAGIMLSKTNNPSHIRVDLEFKDHPAEEWTWNIRTERVTSTAGKSGAKAGASSGTAE